MDENTILDAFIWGLGPIGLAVALAALFPARGPHGDGPREHAPAEGVPETGRRRVTDWRDRPGPLTQGSRSRPGLGPDTIAQAACPGSAPEWRAGAVCGRGPPNGWDPDLHRLKSHAAIAMPNTPTAAAP